MQYRICMKDSWKNEGIDTESVIAPLQERGCRYKIYICFIQNLYLVFSHAGLQSIVYSVPHLSRLA